MSEPKMMHIGEFAEHADLSLRTIRHYDEIGLLVPTGRSEGGFRLYTDEDLARLLLIRSMKPLGYSLTQMSDLLHAISQNEDPASASKDAWQALEDFRRDAEERREKLARQLAMADEFIQQLARRHSS